MTITIEQLRMAALMLNTQRDYPKLMEILKGYGVAKISAVPPGERLACMLAIIDAKMARKHAMWAMTS